MAFNSSQTNGCPCVKDCPDRHPGCHGKCGKYKEWREKMDAISKEKQKEKIRNNTMSDAKKHAIWKTMRHSRQVRYNRIKGD